MTSSASTRNSRCCVFTSNLTGGAFADANLIDQRFQALARRGFGLERFFCALDGAGQAVLLNWLQDIIDGVHFEGLHGVIVERRREDDLRKFSFAVHQLLDHAEAVEARHLHVEKYEVRRMFLDEGEGFDAVFSLADEMHVGETFQQVSQFVARGLLVVDDERIDWHGAAPKDACKVYATGISRSTGGEAASLLRFQGSARQVARASACGFSLDTGRKPTG